MHRCPVGSHSPSVSVLLTAYRSAHLQAAIDSVLAQTLEGFELLLLDDSRDGQVEAMALRSGDRRLRYFPSARLGVALNHDRGLRAAAAPTIAIINHDDEWEPTMLAQLVSALDRYPDAVVAFADHWVMGPDGTIDQQESTASTARWGRAQLEAGLHQPFHHLAISSQSLPMAQCAAWRRGAIGGIPAWASDRYDYWLQIELARTGRGAVYVAERLARFRQHPGNLGNDGTLRRRCGAERFYRHVLLARGLGPEGRAVGRKYVRSVAQVLKWPLWVARHAMSDRHETAQGALAPLGHDAGAR